MPISELPFSFYNLIVATLPHLFLLGLIPLCLYQIQVLMVENIFLRAALSLFVALILFGLTQKSLRINHTRKRIPQMTDLPTYEYLEESMQIGDPLVDRILELSYSSGVKRPIIYSHPSSYKHIEHLPEFQQLQKQLQTVPHWLDSNRIKKTARFYKDNLTLIFGGLAVGLIESYTYAADAKVLQISGGLVQLEGAMKRLTRTVQFVFDVISSDGLPEFGTDAFNNIVNVRFIHALVRRRVLDSPEWDQPIQPINQFAQVGTLIFFCQVPIETMKMRGIAVSPEECEACWQLWRYIGYIMGVDQKLLPKTYEEGMWLKEHPIVATRKIPNEISVSLAHTTIQALDKDRSVPFHVASFTTTCSQVFGSKLYLQLQLPVPSTFDMVHLYLFNFWWCHVRFVDKWSSVCRNWKNFFFLRYLTTTGIVRASSASQRNFY